MKIIKHLLLIKIVLVVVLMLSLWSTRIPDQPFHAVTATTAQQNFHVIEFNDKGQMHDDKQWQALSQRLAQQPGAELLIFIHGWHHNAAPTDENFVAFSSFYQQMAARDPQRNLIGLYIGWRGDSYDPFWLDGSDDPYSMVEPLDFPTIYGRKATARRIGKTGLSDLLDQLDAKTTAGQLQRYVLIGHSLGGAMALHASKERLKQSLEQGKVNPNLYILLNPAVTAKEYKPLDEWLSVDRQKPAMVVLQSKGDFAVKEAFNLLKDGERAMGNSWAITHDMDQCSGNDCSRVVDIPLALQKHDAIPGCMMTLNGTGWKVRARLQARRTVQSCADANMQAVWVLAVSDEIIYGHNGILTEQHAMALSEVMALIDRNQNQLPLHAVSGEAAEVPAAEVPSTDSPDQPTTEVTPDREPQGTDDADTEKLQTEPQVMASPVQNNHASSAHNANRGSAVDPSLTESTLNTTPTNDKPSSDGGDIKR